MYLGHQQIAKRTKRRLKTLLNCQKNSDAPKALRKWRRGIWKKRKAWLERLRVTPFYCGSAGRSAIPCAIMFCESGGSYTAQNASSTAYGRYQLLDTWWGHLGRKPTPYEQDVIAAKLYAGGAGRSHWVC